VIEPIVRGIGDIQAPHVESVEVKMQIFPSAPGLFAGDLALSGFEDKLSAAWPRCHNCDESAFRILPGDFECGRAEECGVGVDRYRPQSRCDNRAALIASL